MDEASGVGKKEEGLFSAKPAYSFSRNRRREYRRQAVLEKAQTVFLYAGGILGLILAWVAFGGSKITWNGWVWKGDTTLGVIALFVVFPLLVTLPALLGTRLLARLWPSPTRFDNLFAPVNPALIEGKERVVERLFPVRGAAPAGVLRVMIVDDSGNTRARLRAMLEEDPAFQVVGESADGFDSILDYERIRPDVVIMNICMPCMDGITATAVICRMHPDADLVMCSVLSEQHYIRRAICAGARYFLMKPPARDEVVSIVRRFGERKRRMRLLESAGGDYPPGREEPIPVPRRCRRFLALAGEARRRMEKLAAAVPEAKPDLPVEWSADERLVSPAEDLLAVVRRMERALQRAPALTEYNRLATLAFLIALRMQLGMMLKDQRSKRGCAFESWNFLGRLSAVGAVQMARFVPAEDGAAG